ncbi:MAG: hypothetical protein EAX96_18595 [Candidatus Lokiarchaeota archaeon]|nr:hypothetical protein [Candidatus Lokiarchaeota archaeon]
MGETDSKGNRYLKEILFEIGKELKYDLNKIKTQLSNVISSEIKYIPVKHHSPGSSILIKKCIEKFKPKLVLVEGPALAEHLIPYIIAQDTRPPIAIISIYIDDENKFGFNGILSPDESVPAKYRVFYPFVSYSPELIALKECMNKKIPIHFIDLPLTALIPYLVEDPERIYQPYEQTHVRYQASDFYQKLAQVFDFENFHETWDTLFEIRIEMDDMEEFRESILTFCSLIREGLSNEFLEKDGTILRESYMKYKIEEFKKQYNLKNKDIMVITGGVHSIALPSSSPKKIDLISEGLLNSLIPYSYFRVSKTSGYGAGNQGPYYYETIWQKFIANTKNVFDLTAIDVITDVFHMARKRGYIISLADTIYTFEGAKLLAMLRRREVPIIKDIVDSIYMTLIKGNPIVEGTYLEYFLQNRLVGYEVGKVTKKIARLPLQEDFYLKLESFGINLEERQQKFCLNLREEKDIKFSEFFWQLKYLDLNILENVSGPNILKGVTGIFTEIWVFNWSPNVDRELVELSILGSTIEEASKNKIIEESKKNIKNFEQISNNLFQTLVMGFNQQFIDLFEVCEDSIEKDDQFISVSRGLNNLILIHQYMLVLVSQKGNIPLIQKLIQRCYFACCFLIPNYSNPPEEMQDDFVLQIKNMTNFLLTLTKINIDLTVFKESLKTCYSASENDFIRGSCIGILHLMNFIKIEDIQETIYDYLKSEDKIKIRIGNYIHGLITTCQSKILFNESIISLLSEVIEHVNWKIFTAILPAMRKAFSNLEPREYEIFIEKLSELFGLRKIEITEFQDEVRAEYLIFFDKIDQKIRKIFEEWFGKV